MGQTPRSRPALVPHPQRVYVDRLSALARDGVAWLDLGCGRHLVPAWFADAAALEASLIRRGEPFAGMDGDLAALRDNTSKRGVCAHSDALPFRSGAFDLVTSNMVFEHLRTPVTTLTEVRRFRRLRGTLIVEAEAV